MRWQVDRACSMPTQVQITHPTSISLIFLVVVGVLPTVSMYKEMCRKDYLNSLNSHLLRRTKTYILVGSANIKMQKTGAKVIAYAEAKARF